MKKLYVILLCLFFMTGCQNKEENVKNEYIAFKKEVLKSANYQEENLPVDIITTIERIDNENINYKTVINNPKENMHNIKIMLVHNYQNENLYPSIGIFDETKELLVENTEEIILEDIIKSNENLSKLDLELKLLIEYIDDFGEKKDIYYKTT